MNASPEEGLFQLALAKPAGKRAAFLDAMCEGDPALRARLAALLAAHENPESVLTGQANSALPTIKLDVASAPTEAVGQTLGRYRLLEQIGEGGCGVVYVAEQKEPVRRKVALKVIKLGMDTKQVVARFEAERQALAMMDHPNIAKVLDAGTTDAGRPYFVMELVRGVKITDYCDQANLGTRDRLELFIKVCHAIQHAHQKGIIHRDIKPSNILVTLHDGVPVPKVIDFGIAKATQGELTDKTIHTQFQQFIGTPAYMSPEQAEMSGLDIDTRSDIYSLGVLLYELLAGSTPFDGRELMSQGIDAMRRTIREKEPQRPSTRLATLGADKLTTTAKRRSADTSKLLHQLKGDLDWIVMKCLEKDRQRRYDTANGLAADLKRHLDNEPVTARPPSQLYRLQKMVRRNQAATVGVASVVLALVLGLGLATAALVRERAARQREQVAQQRERSQSVRADTVTAFIRSLVSDQLPLLLQQGNVRGARELISKADALASSSLSNAPAAELTVRGYLWLALAGGLHDMPAALQQAEVIHRLLPRVTDDHLDFPRDGERVHVSITRLWAAGEQVLAQEPAMKELEGLYAEFMRRTPPAQAFAAYCRSAQAQWLSFAGKTNQAEAAIVEARELLLRAPAPLFIEIPVATQYAALLGSARPAEAERFARETLAKIPSLNSEMRDYYTQLVGELINTLCRLDHFSEATTLLEEQGRWLKTHGGSGTDQVRLDALRAEVLARSGNAQKALPILEAVATNPLSTVDDWNRAANTAAATGDHASFERLLQICSLRFSSTVEGSAANSVLYGLLQQPMDARTLALARGLSDRADDSSLVSNIWQAYANAFLTYREHRYEDALTLLNQFLDTLGARLDKSKHLQPSNQANYIFTRALLCAELGRMEEASRDFARARAQLKLALGDKPGHDRGRDWRTAYQAEARQRETEALFKAKGIPLPEPDAK
jgi:serine/threonine protein kinase